MTKATTKKTARGKQQKSKRTTNVRRPATTKSKAKKSPKSPKKKVSRTTRPTTVSVELNWWQRLRNFLLFRPRVAP